MGSRVNRLHLAIAVAPIALLAVSVTGLGVHDAFAQTRMPRPTTAAPALPASAAQVAADLPELLDADLVPTSYDPRGRRDPFRPLVGDVTDEERNMDELRGLRWQELKLTAIMRTPTGDVAMFEGGPKRQGYMARVGDRLWRAYVHAIDYDGKMVMIHEEATDPRQIKPFIEVPRPLYDEGEPEPAAARRR